MSKFCKCGHSRENHSVRGGFPLCEGTTTAACGCKLYEPETTAKHTQGPWKITRERDGKSGWKGLSVESPSGFVANLVFQLDDSELANARLIAAAPKLLEALKACHLQLLQSNNDSEYAKEASELAQAAIAEAEGGAR